MKISFQLLWDNLSRQFPVQRFGRFRSTVLQWPEIYYGQPMDTSGQVCVVSSDHLPAEPRVGRDCLLICAGECNNILYRSNRFPFWIVSANFAELTNALYSIFRKFNDWEAQLLEIVGTDAKIEHLLEASLPIFENPFNLIDWKMNYCIYMKQEYTANVSNEIDSLPYRDCLTEYQPLRIEDTRNILERIETKGYDRVPRFCTDYYSEQLCCMDLFCGAKYIGTLGLIGVYRPFVPSDSELLQILGENVEKAFRHHLTLLERKNSPLKMKICNLLIDGNETAAEEIRNSIGGELTDTSSPGKESGFFCFKIEYTDDDSPLPAPYLVSLIESEFPECLAFEHGDIIAGFVNLSFSKSNYETVIQRMNEIAVEYHIIIAISNVFQDFMQAHLYYRQACAAIQTSVVNKANGMAITFRHAQLRYLLKNASGEFPIESFCSEGLKQIYRERNEGGDDYWHVLCTFLESGCNSTKTAELLYMHRTTLIKRLNNLSNILQIDFRSPETPDDLFELYLLVQLLKLTDERQSPTIEKAF